MQNRDVMRLEAALRSVLTAQGLPRPRYAVAVPVVLEADGPEVLVEVRASGISQAGDPCFPGGHIEPGESPAEAAARELAEELDIHVPPSRFLGQLPTVQTYLGSQTNLYVVTLAPEEAARVRPAPSEVSELLRVPLSFFLRRPSASSYTFGGHTIWGMTAGAIRYLCAAWTQAAAL